jgi:hypothetical protein
LQCAWEFTAAARKSSKSYHCVKALEHHLLHWQEV